MSNNSEEQPDIDEDAFVEALLDKGKEKGIISKQEAEREKRRVREEKTKTVDLPTDLSTSKMQKARGQFATIERQNAPEEIRWRARELLEETSWDRTETLLAEIRAICERLRDNTETPMAIALGEVRRVYQEIGGVIQEAKKE